MCPAYSAGTVSAKNSTPEKPWNKYLTVPANKIARVKIPMLLRYFLKNPQIP